MNTQFTDALYLAMKWREDVAGHRGGLIEQILPSRGIFYTRKQLKMPRIVASDLLLICVLANTVWRAKTSELLIRSDGLSIFVGEPHNAT